MLKLAIAKLLKKFLFPFTLLPLREKTILLFSYQGKNYSCNPKYLTEYILEHNALPGVKLIWAFKNPEPYRYLEDKGVKVIRYYSPEFFRTFFTAAVIITNSSNLPFLPKHKGQILINTWHGGGAYKSELYDLKLTKFKNENVDYFLSSCGAFTQNMVKSTGLFESKFIQSGMPRNDIFFFVDEAKKNALKVKMNLDIHIHYLMYAPTYRDSRYNFEHPDFNLLLPAYKKRFGGEWGLIVRGHYNDVNEFKGSRQAKGYIDMSTYDDMQELLYISDAVITDYSSLIWDYSFLNRPCILYAPDYKKYEEERGFYYPIKTWGFPVASSSLELKDIIENFDFTKFKLDMREHHNRLENFENGLATEKVVTLLKSILI